MRLSMFTKYFVCFIHVFTAIPLDGAQMMLSIKLFNFNISTMHTNSQYKRLLFSYLIVFFVIVSGFKILNFLKVNHFWQFNSGQRNVNWNVFERNVRRNMKFLIVLKYIE